MSCPKFTVCRHIATIQTNCHAGIAQSYEIAANRSLDEAAAEFYLMVADTEDTGIPVDQPHGMDKYLLASIGSLTYVPAISHNTAS